MLHVLVPIRSDGSSERNNLCFNIPVNQSIYFKDQICSFVILLFGEGFLEKGKVYFFK